MFSFFVFAEAPQHAKIEAICIANFCKFLPVVNVFLAELVQRERSELKQER